MGIEQSSNAILNRALLLARRPILGPMLLGMLLGGVPIGILLLCTDMDQPSVSYGITCASALVASVGAILGADSRPSRLLFRSFLVSFGVWIPIPIPTLAFLLRDWGSWFEPAFLDIASILALLMLTATVAGWLLALSFRFLRNKHLRTSRAV